jgi:hypothetical protein
MLFLNRLLAPQVCSLQFAFGLQPIIQIAAGLLATFQIDLVGGTSDLLFGHWTPDLSGNYFGFYV